MHGQSWMCSASFPKRTHCFCLQNHPEEVSIEHNSEEAQGKECIEMVSQCPGCQSLSTAIMLLPVNSELFQQKSFGTLKPVRFASIFVPIDNSILCLWQPSSTKIAQCKCPETREQVFVGKQERTNVSLQSEILGTEILGDSGMLREPGCWPKCVETMLISSSRSALKQLQTLHCLSCWNSFISHAAIVNPMSDLCHKSEAGNESMTKAISPVAIGTFSTRCSLLLAVELWTQYLKFE